MTRWRQPVAMILTLIVAGHAGSIAADECDPYRYRPTPPAPDPQRATSFLLELRPPDIPPSFVLGTYHTADRSVLAAWSRATLLMGTAGTRVFVSERDLEQAVAPGDQQLPSAERLSTLLTGHGDLFERVATALADQRLGIETVDRLKPWFAALRINQAAALPKWRHQTVLDAMLQDSAESAGLDSRFLEGFGDIARYHDVAFPIDRQIGLLWEAICNRSSVTEQIHLQTASYAANDVAAFQAAGAAFESADPGLAEGLADVFVRQRNAAFWPVLRDEILQGGSFVAIGNTHVLGPTGLLERLRSEHPEVAIRPIDPRSLQLSIAAEAMPVVTGWVAGWLTDQGAEPDPDSLFDGVSIAHASPPALQDRLCPGKACQVEATYLPGTATVLLSDAVMAQIMRSPVAPRYRLGTDGFEPAETTPPPDEHARAESLLVRELTRHALYRTVGAALRSEFVEAYDPPHCLRTTVLHWASLAQLAYLRAAHAKPTAQYFALDIRCPEVPDLGPLLTSTRN